MPCPGSGTDVRTSWSQPHSQSPLEAEWGTIARALIAAVLFQFYSGRRPSKRQMELIQMYLLGWATAEELVRLLQEPARRESARKKS